MSTTPKLYEHATQTQWGRCIVVEAIPERTRYLFEDGQVRAFRSLEPHMREAQLPEAERDALVQLLLRRNAPKRTSSKSGASRRAAEALTFEAQEKIFRAVFPQGFEDPKYVLEERGTKTGKDRYKDAAIELAAGILAPAELDRLIAEGKDTEVYDRAVRVERVTKNLLYPQREKPEFESMPPASHARFARALRAALYDSEEYAARFDDLVSSIAMKSVTWPAATLLPAIVHPTEHVFVKASFSERQARILGMDEPPRGIPTGHGYAKHLAVAHALRERLIATGHRPRDLFDVYSFAWKTLSDAAAKPVKKAAVASEIDD